MSEQQGEWVTMSEAAKEIGVNLSKISRLASQNKIESRINPFDERTRLVNLDELRRYFHIEKK